MKVKLFAILIVFALIAGCTGQGELKINNDALTNSLAYGAGKGMAIAVNKIYPAMDAELTKAWVELMDANRGKDEIPSSEMVSFYNQCMGIISPHVGDEYEVIGDLGAMLTAFGAEFETEEGRGRLIVIQPIPKMTMTFFGNGWASGRRVAQR